MTGNDVVDLKLAEKQSNWRRKNFLEKVFRPQEQELILTSEIPERMVWLLWSMKEAGYKLFQRKNHLPRKLFWKPIECTISEVSDRLAVGKVRIGGEAFFTQSRISENFIHTWAEESEAATVLARVRSSTSENIVSQLIRLVSIFEAVSGTDLRLVKNSEGIPFLLDRKGSLHQNFSLSRHGRFGAFSLSLNNCERPVKHS